MSERMTDERYALLTKSHAFGHSPFAAWDEFVAERQHIAELEAELLMCKRIITNGAVTMEECNYVYEIGQAALNEQEVES